MTDNYKKIVESINKLSDTALDLEASGLSTKAVLVLLAHSTGLPQKTIKVVLEALPELRNWCLNHDGSETA
jgi:hypothetical protein